MSAIPRLQPVAVQPLLRPHYNVSARALYDLASFVTENAAELNRYYDQLRAEDPEDFCSREDFYATQYECQLLIREKYEQEARDERAREPRYSNFDRATGIRKSGPI